ncbi:MAG: hypothetical protein Q9186_002646 [Xanthomendoza sp. 1 TL-2023]
MPRLTYTLLALSLLSINPLATATPFPPTPAPTTPTTIDLQPRGLGNIWLARKCALKYGYWGTVPRDDHECNLDENEKSKRTAAAAAAEPAPAPFIDLESRDLDDDDERIGKARYCALKWGYFGTIPPWDHECRGDENGKTKRMEEEEEGDGEGKGLETRGLGGFRHAQMCAEKYGYWEKAPEGNPDGC